MPSSVDFRPEIVLIHRDRAHLPELSAYQDVLGRRFAVSIANPPVRAAPRGVLWYFMGLHPIKVKARFVIHDYRSLSVGRLMILKDHLKKVLNPRPDLRIFLNEHVEHVLGFTDGVPSARLDMGVPDWIDQYRSTTADQAYDFCYIGEISRERRTDRMIEAFLASAYRDRRLALIGRCQAAIRERFDDAPNVLFRGVMPQRELFAEVARSDYAISHFPAHRPHKYQTPTKLLEYAALGKRIIANRSPSNLRTARETGIHVVWTGDDIFSDLQIRADDGDNLAFDHSGLSWSARFAQSGVLELLDACFSD